MVIVAVTAFHYSTYSSEQTGNIHPAFHLSESDAYSSIVTFTDAPE